MAHLLREVADCCCRSAIGLTDLDQVPVGVTQVATDLGSAVDRRGEELRAAGAPVRVDGGDVGDAGVEEGADPVRVGGRLEGKSAIGSTPLLRTWLIVTSQGDRGAWRRASTSARAP